ncbi:MAG: serine hydrolase domain-containing protein, partial [Acidimicrobiia bacterium]
CNAGYILLGLVVEELTGRSYIEYVENEIFRAAGMDDSGFFRLDDAHPRVAIGYVADPQRGWKTNHYSIPVVGGPDGGAFSTVRDLSKFLDALARCEFFGEETGGVMRAAHVMNEDIHYGYGLAIREHGDRACFGHGGADPGFSARAFRYPELDMNVTMLGNTIDETDPVIEAFRSALED